ncbi:MAG TPA: nuclear transport factor 2 family protein [Gaiellaceae bacterium]|nr:nuclear transport factor 2 family protein [Gaiellaceae bacterium]
MERQRLRALVAADLGWADELHAGDFRLVTPGGASLSKAEYLGGVASGAINYLRWEPEEIEARVRANAGCLRYRSTIEIVVEGRELPPTRCWHTDYYERRDGRWQVVWSQATQTSTAGET